MFLFSLSVMKTSKKTPAGRGPGTARQYGGMDSGAQKKKRNAGLCGFLESGLVVLICESWLRNHEPGVCASLFYETLLDLFVLLWFNTRKRTTLSVFC